MPDRHALHRGKGRFARLLATGKAFEKGIVRLVAQLIQDQQVDHIEPAILAMINAGVGGGFIAESGQRGRLRGA